MVPKVLSWDLSQDIRTGIL